MTQPRRTNRRSVFRKSALALGAAGAAVALAVGVGAGPAAAVQIGGFDVGGAILKEYNRAGAQAFFGNPTGPESAATGGRFQAFQNDVSIYWSVGTDAHAVGGAIRAKWGSIGWERSPLGFPITDEQKAGNDGAGRDNMFNGGVIYWSQDTGAHVVWGQIYQIWNDNVAEKGKYGYPTGDEYDYNGGKAQQFQGGTIVWKP